MEAVQKVVGGAYGGEGEPAPEKEECIQYVLRKVGILWRRGWGLLAWRVVLRWGIKGAFLVLGIGLRRGRFSYEDEVMER